MDQLRELNPAAEQFAPETDRSNSYSRWLRAVEATAKF
jgi:hypothetical protein